MCEGATEVSAGFLGRMPISGHRGCSLSKLGLLVVQVLKHRLAQDLGT